MADINNKAEQVDKILTLADRLFRQLLPAVPEEILNLDVTMPQMKILLMLYIHGPMRMSDLAAELKITLPTATSLVERLVEKNFVLRENRSEDRRVVICRMAEEGQKALSGIWESARRNSQELLEGLDYAKLVTFTELLEDMLKTPMAKKLARGGGETSYKH